MLDRTDLLSLEIRARDLIGEEDAKFWTQARVFRAINEEVMRLAREVIELDMGYFLTTYTVTPTSATVALPANFYKLNYIEVYKGSQWYSVRPIWARDRYIYTAESGNQDAIAFRFEGTNIVFESGLGSVTSCKMHYSRLPAEMRYEVMAAAAATSFTMATTASIIDDVYIGDVVATLSGTGSGQYRTVTDYVGSTKVATVATWTVTPSTDTYYSTLLPHPLSLFPDLVATGAAIRLIYRRRDDNLLGMLKEQYGIDFAKMVEHLTARQVSQPQRVHYVPDWDELYESEG